MFGSALGPAAWEHSLQDAVWSEAIVRDIVALVPEWVAILLGVLSHLGSVWFVVPAVVGAFLLHRTARSAAWLGIVGGAYGSMIAVKALFSIDRPDVAPPVVPETLHPVVRAVYAPSVEIGTTAFPSGHVLIAVVVWGLFVVESGRSTATARLAAATVAVLLVGIARVALGVHYPIDVLGGLVVGACYLLAVTWLLSRVRDRATVAFSVGVGTAWLGTLSWGDPLPALLLGGLVGGLLGGQWIRWKERRRRNRFAVGGALVCGLSAAAVVTTVGFALLLVGVVGGLLVVGGSLSGTDADRFRRSDGVPGVD